VGIRIGIELRRWDGGDANLVDEEPAELEIARAAGDMGREGVVLWEFDRGHIAKDKIAALGVGVLINGQYIDRIVLLGRIHTGMSSSSKTAQNRSIFFFISVRLSSQKPAWSACSNATADASCKGETLL
jgi:hypothetical protein